MCFLYLYKLRSRRVCPFWCWLRGSFFWHSFYRFFFLFFTSLCFTRSRNGRAGAFHCSSSSRMNYVTENWNPHTHLKIASRDGAPNHLPFVCIGFPWHSASRPERFETLLRQESIKLLLLKWKCTTHLMYSAGNGSFFSVFRLRYGNSSERSYMSLGRNDVIVSLNSSSETEQHIYLLDI